MLCYFNSGARNYAECPVRANAARGLWEFQAVLEGRIVRVEPGGRGGVPAGSTLWLAGPEARHGWGGVLGERAEIVVFHFRHVPALLAQLVGSGGHVALPLDDAGKRRLGELAERVRPYCRRPAPAMLLCFESVLSELSFLVYEKCAKPDGSGSDSTRRRVARALEYFDARLDRNPGLSEVAAHVGVSPAHLRRLFQKTFARPPNALFEQIRERRMLELLTDTDCTLAEVAEKAGYSDPSALSRTCRRRFGCPPGAMRSGALVRGASAEGSPRAET